MMRTMVLLYCGSRSADTPINTRMRTHETMRIVCRCRKNSNKYNSSSFELWFMDKYVCGTYVYVWKDIITLNLCLFRFVFIRQVVLQHVRRVLLLWSDIIYWKLKWIMIFRDLLRLIDVTHNSVFYRFVCNLGWAIWSLSFITTQITDTRNMLWKFWKGFFWIEFLIVADLCSLAR